MRLPYCTIKTHQSLCEEDNNEKEGRGGGGGGGGKKACLCVFVVELGVRLCTR